MNNNYRTQNFSDAHIYRRFSGGLYRVASRGQGGWIADFISGIFYLFISMGAFTVRVFLRTKMGSRSIGLLSIILSYFWLRFFLIHVYVYEYDCAYFNNLENGLRCDYQAYLYYYAEPFIDLFNYLIVGINDYEFNIKAYAFLLPEKHPTGAAYSIHIFSLLVIVLGFLHFISSIIRDIRKIKWHSFHRGNSIFFGWLKGKKLFGLVEVNEYIIWTVIDPIWIIFIAYFLELYYGLWALALTVKIGAICLGIQEFQIWNRNRDMIRNMVDQEIDSSILLAEREKYKELKTNESNSILAEQKAKAIIE